FEATPRRKNWTVKTPCLKCGLIHDEPTAICDGYAGIDPDETAGDSKKQAAARIRAVLAAVPIESRRPGRARAAAAGAGASASESTAAMRAAGAGPAQADPAMAGPAEVPEWRREVSERLETYRNRRARQSRQAGTTNQTILGFRVHSKTDSLEQAEEMQAAPAAEAASIEGAVETQAAVEAAVPAAEPMAAASVAAGAVASEPAAVTSAARNAQRVYAPDETDLTASLSEHAFAAAVESTESDTEAPENMSIAEENAPSSLPMAAEPAVVLADSATLEVHADPEEQPLRIEDDEETARLSPAASAQISALAAPAPATNVRDSGPAAEQPAMDSAPLAVIPAIDKDYWRGVPGVGPDAGTMSRESNPETEELECGSLTSGFESPVAGIEEVMEEELVPAEEVESASLPGENGEPPLHPATAEPSQPTTEEAPLLPAAIEEPATEALAAAENTSDLLSPDALETPETEVDSRRAALRTASRPQPGTVPERMEISVPQPVFDFSAASQENEQPQDDSLPVADLRERRRAALLDATLVGVSIAGFFFAFHLAGGEFSFSRVGAAVGVAAAFLIYAQYILLFTLVGGATPGMVLRGLRVVCFDGRPPATVELAWRAFGYLLSAAAGMIGFLWSTWDEHGLSWHDRISQTYITYVEPEGEPVIATVH
ncbi:MAG TPA: RDD family protein, partial [Candidatus Acidoferrales bacterium]|nr:RDD family protein [Candidatus Acidoferrales bacterium]